MPDPLHDYNLANQCCHSAYPACSRAHACLSPALLIAQCTPGQVLILLDACYSDDPVAYVRHFSIDDLETVRRPASSHGFDIRQALALSQALHGENTPVSIIGICAGATPDGTDTLAPGDILKKALPALLNIIDEAVRFYTQKAD